MARPKKQRKKQTKLSVDELLHTARTHFEKGRYKEAVASYNLLLKKDPQPSVVEGLANAYEARAKQLSSKGMHKEALVIWQNRSNACQCSAITVGYLCTLLQLNRQDEMVELAIKHWATLAQEKDVNVLESHLAALILTPKHTLLDQFPENSIWHQHKPAAEQLLQAYHSSKADLSPWLKRISFRSPFRDLRGIVSALTEVNHHPEIALSRLTKIPKTSAFMPLVQLIQVAALQGGAFVTAFVALSAKQQQAILDLKGWDQSVVAFCQSWQQAGSSPKALFGFVVKYRAMFGDEKAKAICQQLLTHNAFDYGRFVKHFTKLPDYEMARLRALTSENSHEFDGYDTPSELWDECGEAYIKAGKTQYADEIAAVYAHAAKREEDPYDQVAFLEKSIEYNPEGVDTYLMITRMHHELEDAKQFRVWADKTVKKFPQNPVALEHVILSATDNGTFKKATKFAKQLLAIDPINESVKAVLSTSHLKQARKQITAGKFHLAIKELDSAAEWDHSKKYRHKILITRGLLAWQEGDVESAKAHFTEAKAHSGTMTSYFQLWADASWLKISPATVAERLGWQPMAKQMSIKEVLLVVDLIEQSGSWLKGVWHYKQAVDMLTPALKASASHAFSEANYTLICTCFEKIKYYDLLLCYGEQASVRFSESPLLGYYYLVAQVNGQLYDLTSKQESYIFHLFRMAEENDDQQVLNLLQPYLPIPFGNPFMSLGEGFLGEDEGDYNDDFPNASPAVLEVMMKLMTTPGFDEFAENFDPEDVKQLIEVLLGQGIPAKKITLESLEKLMLAEDIF